MSKSKPPRQPARTANAQPSAQPPTVAPLWLITVLGSVVVGGLVFTWIALCFVFWQGNWQLLYHPTSKITRTPAVVGLAFNSVGLATTEAGVPRLSGWWIPAAPGAPGARYTALYLHGATGNLSNTLDDLQRLHAAGLTVLAIDYRGYGQSRFVHPSQDRWRQDAEWALQYLTGTRHAAPGSILLVGQGLGADLALEIAAAHPNLAGVVLQQPRHDPTAAIFHDPRAFLVPAHWLVSDRWDLDTPAARMRIPSLWFEQKFPPGPLALPDSPATFQKIAGPKAFVWFVPSSNQDKGFVRILDGWLRDLPNQGHNFPACQLSSGMKC
ncbi:MAG TPA: alpha/beta hydrolase [Terracidiphilus sp.]|nr:alpha/beta hydrolase [Terracidiphilus sp.]